MFKILLEAHYLLMALLTVLTIKSNHPVSFSKRPVTAVISGILWPVTLPLDFLRVILSERNL